MDFGTFSEVPSEFSEVITSISSRFVLILFRGSNGNPTHNVDRSVALEVSDTGPGISEQQRSKIFELFYSTKNSSGFGLWSARRNAFKNHGDLEVMKSQPGQGATFRLLLPRVDEGGGRIP